MPLCRLTTNSQQSNHGKSSHPGVGSTKDSFINFADRGTFDFAKISMRSFQNSIKSRDESRFAPSQWETPLQSNAVSHWLRANLEVVLKSIRWRIEIIPIPFFYFALVIYMLLWKIYLISIGSHSYFRCVTAAKLHWRLASTNVLFNSAITFRNGKGDGILSSAPTPGYHPTQPLPVIH